MLDPAILGLVWSLCVGAALGSFAGVCIARWPAEGSILRPASRCDHCRRALRWFDNLPLLAYPLCGGRCRRCRARIGARTWLLELMGAALGSALWLRFGASFDLLVWLLLFCGLLVVIFLDLDHFWVPDLVTYPGAVWALLCAMLPGRLGLPAALAGLLPALLLWLTGWAFERLTGKEAMGLGDVKLLAMLGLALGAPQTLLLLLLAALQGSVLGFLLLQRPAGQALAQGDPAADRGAKSAANAAAVAPSECATSAWTGQPSSARRATA